MAYTKYPSSRSRRIGSTGGIAFTGILFVYVFLLAGPSCAAQDICTSKATCSSCITAASNCAWCKLQDRNLRSTSRCNSLENIRNICPPNDIVNPEANVSTTENKPLNKPGDPISQMVQLAPQRLTMKIRPNSPQNITIRFRQAQDYPVDLYYLMDLSYSMNDDKSNLERLGNKLGQSMASITRNFRLGFGSFVDKTVPPYIQIQPEYLDNPCYPNNYCKPAYGFINNMPLNNDTTLFQREVQDSAISGNVDSPEGSFDAVMQAIVCKTEIGWRDKARKILLVATDAEFHQAGDGKLGGVVVPNDGLCHLNSKGHYTKSTEQDYPSISHINKVVTDNSMNVIFAVTQPYLSTYQRLNREITASYSSTLNSDSSNIVQLIVDQYQKISSTVELKDNSTENVKVTYYSRCLNTGGPLQKTNICNNLKTGTTVEFFITVEVTSCPTNPKDRKQVFVISPLGLNETLTVDLEMICECDCEQTKETNSGVCTNVGTYVCGICDCPSDKIGEYCECDQNAPGTDNDQSLCMMRNSSVICSGRGSCACGKCSCYPGGNNQRIYGPYCECDNFSCNKYQDLPCGGPGRGTCDCGVCKCNSKWTGPACECPSTQTSCVGPNGAVCSGNGICKCGSCQCPSTFGGSFCEQSLTPGGKCMEYRWCAECRGFHRDDWQSICGECSRYSVEVVPDLDAENISSLIGYKCSFENSDGCNFFFMFYQTDNQTHLIVQEQIECPEPVNVPLVVGSVIGAIVAIGLLTLLIWKLLTTLHDKREYAKFQDELLRAKWSKGENPLFVEPVNSFSNPTFGKRLTYFFKN